MKYDADGVNICSAEKHKMMQKSRVGGKSVQVACSICKIQINEAANKLTMDKNFAFKSSNG